MLMRKIELGLHQSLEKLINSMGYELIGGEIQPQGRRFILRIYIDSPAGVSVDDCALVSNQVSAMLDVNDPFSSSYALEVSSPGFDRPLFEIKHFKQFIGKEVRIRLRKPLNNRRQYKGILQAVEGDLIYLLADDLQHEVKISFDDIEKANLIGRHETKRGDRRRN